MSWCFEQDGVEVRINEDALHPVVHLGIHSRRTGSSVSVELEADAAHVLGHALTSAAQRQARKCEGT